MRPKFAEKNSFTSPKNRQFGINLSGGASLAALAAGLVLGGGVLSAPSAYALAGIMATGSGPGPLTVSAPAVVTETNGDGINATNNSPGTDLTVTATDVSASQDGIDATNNGTGALSVTSTGSVTATNLGIRAINFGTDLTIATASVSGSTGINGRNDGTGSLSVTASGTVTGTSFRGVVARNQGLGLDLDINVVDVTGAADGIYANNLGRGALSVTSTGTVAGTSTYGIFARNSGTDLTISVDDVSGRSSRYGKTNLETH
jgi:autotransporter family porin